MSGHGQQVDDAGEVIFGADGDLHGNGVGIEAFSDHVDAAIEVGADTVHFVDESDTGNAVAVCLTPYGFGLRLYTADGAENTDRAVENSQGAFDLYGKVHMAGRVDNVDAMTFPDAGGCRRGNGDTAFLFLNHVVHGGGAVVYFADAMYFTCKIKHAFGCRCFTGVDVSHDADISCIA